MYDYTKKPHDSALQPNHAVFFLFVLMAGLEPARREGKGF
jgi:hypothetical protein